MEYTWATISFDGELFGFAVLKKHANARIPVTLEIVMTFVKHQGNGYGLILL